MVLLYCSCFTGGGKIPDEAIDPYLKDYTSLFIKDLTPTTPTQSPEEKHR